MLNKITFGVFVVPILPTRRPRAVLCVSFKPVPPMLFKRVFV
jgi:hypothetical protein